MRRMNKLMICGIPYKIVLCDDNFGTDTDRSFGQVDYEKQLIKINKELSVEVMEETICHEIVHAMLQHIGYAEMSKDESFVQGFANAIYQTFIVRHEE